MSKKIYTCPFCLTKFDKFRIKEINGTNLLYCPQKNKEGKFTCDHVFTQDFLDHEYRNIAIFGGIDAGKSTFIAALINLLTTNGDIRKHLKIHASFLRGDTHSETLFKRYWKKIVKEGVFPDASSRSDQALKHPIVLSIKNTETRKAIYLTFFDTPGEEFDTVEGILTNHPYICHADAILFFMDPLQIETILELVLESDRGRRLSDLEITDKLRIEGVVANLYNALLSKLQSEHNKNLGEQEMSPTPKPLNNLLIRENDQLNDILKRFKEKFSKDTKIEVGGKRIAIPIVFCLSKFDLVGGLGRMKGFRNAQYYDHEFFMVNSPVDNSWKNTILESVNDLSTEISDYLREYQPILFEDLQQDFSNFKMIGIASAVAANESFRKVKLINFNNRDIPLSKNLLLPLVWVLEELSFFSKS